MVAALLALLRAFLCGHGVQQMRADAEHARDRLPPDSPWRAAAQLLGGRTDRADPVLADAVDLAIALGALPAAAAALAERCIMAMDRHAWSQAEDLAERAVGIVDKGQLADYIMSPLVHAAAARMALHRGDLPGAHQHLARAARLRPLLTCAIPQFAVQTQLELARSYLALGDVAGARVVLREAGDVLQRRPDLGILPQHAAQLRAQLGQVRGGIPGASSLTRAELRVLPLLSTHLSYRAIGGRLYISHNTVKAHALAIYRKLDTSSRSQTIRRAQELGLLGG
jgi:LuxR family transcriptional regulator, maltose regulon positive regulatory protein